MELESPGLQRSFGARVRLEATPVGLFLVTASRSGTAEPAVRTAGGTVVLRVGAGPGGREGVIARLTLAQALSLEHVPGIGSVGGVQMNVERYRRTLELLRSQAPGPTPPSPVTGGSNDGA